MKTNDVKQSINVVHVSMGVSAVIQTGLVSAPDGVIAQYMARKKTMPTPADRPLRKCTLNLYEEDCQTLEQVYGQGWTVEVRNAVLRHAQNLHHAGVLKRRTLGDLDA